MAKIVITFDIAEQRKYLVVSDATTWEGLCKSATLYNGKKKKKISAKNIEMRPGLNTVELELEDSDTLCDELFKDTWITSCIIEEGVKVIGHECFAGCRRLHSITLPSTLTIIGSEAFTGCDALEVLSIPSSVTCASCALQGFNLDKVQFAPGITVLPSEIFARCENSRQELRIPEGIVKLNNEDGNNMYLRGLQFPSSIKKINSGAISRSTFGHFEWPEQVPVKDQDITITGERHSELKYMPLPESADVMILTGDYNCNTLVVPANIKAIRFEGCGHIETLRHIYVDPANKVYDSRENCNAIIETASGKMILAGELTTVPEGVTVIAKTAQGITKTGVFPVLPSSLKKIYCNL